MLPNPCRGIVLYIFELLFIAEEPCTLSDVHRARVLPVIFNECVHLCLLMLHSDVHASLVHLLMLGTMIH